jgi:serine/threonine protein kinase
LADNSIAPQIECVVKSAPANRLRQEHELLQKFPNHPSIRQLIDYVEEEPPSLILEHLECDSLQASREEKLSRPDIKFIAKNVLEALKSFHDLGFAHTGKTDPQNPPAYQPRIKY